jgi:hypothetical protein
MAVGWKACLCRGSGAHPTEAASLSSGYLLYFYFRLPHPPLLSCSRARAVFVKMPDRMACIQRAVFRCYCLIWSALFHGSDSTILIWTWLPGNHLFNL